jgi:hypothetical protein
MHQSRDHEGLGPIAERLKISESTSGSDYGEISQYGVESRRCILQEVTKGTLMGISRFVIGFQ